MDLEETSLNNFKVASSGKRKGKKGHQRFST